LPLLCLGFIPAFKSRFAYVALAVNVAVFVWVVLLLLRVIGGLADTGNAGSGLVDVGAAKRASSWSPSRSTLITAGIIFPVAVLVGWIDSPPPSDGRMLFKHIFATELCICFIVATVQMVLSLVLHFLANERASSPTTTKLMGRGVDLLCWTIGGFGVYGFIFGDGFSGAGP